MRDTTKGGQELPEDIGAPAAAEELENSASAEQSPQDVDERIKSADAAFHRGHVKGLALSLGNLWFSFAAMVAAAVFLSQSMADPMTGIIIAVVLAVLLYAVVAYVLGLRIDLAHERKVNGIRRSANLGVERIRIDDPELVREALREVLGEWMHGALLLRSLRETSFWYRGAVAAQVVISFAAITAFVSLSPFTGNATLVIVSAALLLTIAHGWRETRASRLRGHACMISQGLDPTDAVSSRLVNLLEEVRALRRQRRDA